MGVDLQTYRAKIGTFRHAVGVDVVTVVCCVNFTSGLKTIGSVVFVGLLLLIAGIEPNPCPKEDELERLSGDKVQDQSLPTQGEDRHVDRDSVTCTGVNITDLPENTEKETLKGTTDNKSRRGGGNVKNTCISRSPEPGRKPAITEPEEAEGVLNSTAHTQLKVTDLPENVDEELLVTIFEDTKRQGGGKVTSVLLDKWNKTAIIEFEKPEAVAIILKKRPIKFAGKVVSVDTLSNVDEGNIESAVVQVVGLPSDIDEDMLGSIFEKKGAAQVRRVTIDKALCTAEIEFKTSEAIQVLMSKRPIIILGKEVTLKLQSFDSGTPEKYQRALQIIRTLQLDMLDRKLSVADVLAISPGVKPTDETTSFKDLPLLFLKQIVSSNCDFMDLSMYNLQSSGTLKSKSSKGSVMAMFEEKSNQETISPLDLLLISFQCCDPELRQLLFQKMYLCKTAVPFFFYDFFLKSTIMSVWPLHAILIENKTVVNDSETVITESEVLEMPTQVISFARFGRPYCSKSKLLNGLLSNSNANIFFNRECQSGLMRKYASEGYAEMFWLPNVCDKRFKDPITFINLRGDISIHFSEEQHNMFSKLTDIIVLVVDLSVIVNSGEYLKNFLCKFKCALVIIGSPLYSDDERAKTLLTQLESSIKSTSETSLHLLSSYVGSHEKTQSDMRVEILDQITEFMSSITNYSPTLQSRIDVCSVSIRTDTHSICMSAQKKALEVLEEMKEVSPQAQWTKTVTPVQYIHSKKLGKLLKQLSVEKHQTNYYKFKQEIYETREKQTQTSKTVKSFICNVIQFSNNPESLHYFLVWLKIFLEREKRKTAIKMNREHQKLWDNYNTLKSEDNPNDTELKRLENEIQESESKLEEASFGIANFFRELSHLYDAMLNIKLDQGKSGMPLSMDVAKIYANLFMNGHTLELLDGNCLYMPTEWNNVVFNIVNESIDSKKVVALSVLGLQSSGKSTLLNTMFGVQFTASSGRCTRGIHAQMIPLKFRSFENEQNKFDYALIIDTEGLRAPELKNTSYQRDNELATIITGLGDITILNVMGENTAEIRDILQIIVHAFLRLNLANPRVDIIKRCIFIHQNVSDISASEKMKAGLQISVKALDEVTKESADSEGISNINRFDQVIAFNSENDVWYLPNLWTGNPPMAQINRKYSERVVDICHELLRRSMKDVSKSFKSLHDLVIHTDDLWKGVLAENFVFSFKNSLEKKACMALENKIKEEFWKTENAVDVEVLQLCKKHFKNCKCDSSLSLASNTIKYEIKQFIANLETSLLKFFDKYFEKNNYTQYTIQWKERTMNQINNFSDDLFIRKQPEIDSLRQMKLCEVMTDTENFKYEETFRQISVDSAKRLKGQNLSKTQIETEFEKIWDNVVTISINTDGAESDKTSLRQYFVDRLSEIFKHNHSLLFAELHQHSMLEKQLSIEKLCGSVSKSGVGNDDISVKSVVYTVASKLPFVNKYISALKVAKQTLNTCFSAADTIMAKLNQNDRILTDSDIRSFLHEVHGLIVKGLNVYSEQFSAKVTFYVKALVHVSNFSCFEFEKHNTEFINKNGVKAKMERFKKHCLERFVGHLHDRRREEMAAMSFKQACENYIRGEVLKCMSCKAKQTLQPLLPTNKYSFIVTLLENLMQRNSFQLFIAYVTSPESYADSWLTSKSEEYLFQGDKCRFYVDACNEVSQHIYDLKRAVQASSLKFKNKSSMPEIGEWVDYMQEELSYCDLPLDSFEAVQSEFKDSSVNMENFEHNILKQLDDAESSLQSEFRSVRADTVKWRVFNPYVELMKLIWGCKANCIFCCEPCRKPIQGHPGPHECIQHRPSGVNGVHNSVTREIWLNTCDYDLAIGTTPKCSMFKFACNAGQGPCSLDKHPFVDYKKYFSNWDIMPDSDRDETATFWFWFIWKYKYDLAKRYNIIVSNVPSKWQAINDQTALESLKKIYRSLG